MLLNDELTLKLPPDSVRQVLQTATRHIHDRMHRHPGLSRLANGTVDRDEYRCLLARSFGFYAVVEPMLGLAGNLTQCLVQDLTELGIGTAAIEALPRCGLPPIGCDQAALIGARYVLFGASLGGKVMARAIVGRTDSRTALPVRFLTGLGENDWKVFVAQLDDRLPDAVSRSAAAIAAMATFAAYEDWMTWHE